MRPMAQGQSKIYVLGIKNFASFLNFDSLVIEYYLFILGEYMRIQVLETSCCGSGFLHQAVIKIAEELKINAEIEAVGDLMEIMKFDIIMPPALVIDGKVKLQGHSISEREIKNVLQEAVE